LEYTPGREVHTILPIQLCDLAWVAAAWALWTRRAYPVALTYYWGLTLTTQAVITPALAEGFPSLRFVAFWGTHLLVVWAAVFLTWGLGLRPTWRGYRGTVLTTLVWAAVVFTINANTGTNYGFLNRKPSTPSILDLLGPWPFYVVLEIVIVLSVWALITWPWVAAGRRAAVEPARGSDFS
ncbi:MAG: TIGR02206 family membrane protein, partial [Actinomycetes bacterium]